MFSETVEIKIPCTVTERRKITQCAYNNLNHIDNNNSHINNNSNNNINDNNDKHIFSEYRIGNNNDINSIADRLVGLPVYSLYVEASRLLKELALRELKERTLNKERYLRIVKTGNRQQERMKGEADRENCDKRHINKEKDENRNTLANRDKSMSSFDSSDNNNDNNNNNNNNNKSNNRNNYSNSNDDNNSNNDNNDNNKNYHDNDNKNYNNNDNNIMINKDDGKLKDKFSLSFPCVYGQAEAKRAITECLLWPKVHNSLYSILCPGGKCSTVECSAAQ